MARTPFPTDQVILQTKLPTQELVAKLEHIGVPKDAILQPITLTPKMYGETLIVQFVFFGVVLAVYSLLLRVFQNRFRDSSKSNDSGT